MLRCFKNYHLIVRSEEATDPAGLPAGVSHEHPRGDTHPPPGPVLTPRVFIMTPGLHPPTGLGAAPLHEVEHVSARDFPDVLPHVTRGGEMSVQVTCSPHISPLSTQPGFVFHSPGLT